MKNTFKINLDTTILYRLRNKINEQNNISYNKIYGKFRAWDKICAIMDRLDDTVDFLNELKLNTGRYERSAFDFYEFMNNSSVIVDCIKELAKIFNVSDDKIKKSTNIFNRLGKDNKGTDEKYFEYLRSLCSVHPVETSRHKRYQDNDFECSPFVLWNNTGICNDDYDIYAVVYTSKDECANKRVGIYMNQIFKYIETRLNFVNDIIDEIDKYQKKVIEDFINTPIKREEEFENYIEYLKNLDIEMKLRFGSDTWYRFEYVIRLLELKVSNPYNEDKINLYINALKYAIKFEHNNIQNMSNIGFENNGLLYNENKIETTLYIELQSPYSGSQETRKYGYNLEKIGYLNYDSGSSNKSWAYIQLKQASDFLERYVSFQGAQGDFEYYALVQTALYLDCLENKCLINKNIPNDLKYRKKLLSNNELN